jgi:hypothetical protein
MTAFGESEQEALQALRLAPREPHARAASADVGLMAAARGALRAAGPAAVVAGGVIALGHAADMRRSVSQMTGGRDSISRLEGEQQLHSQIGAIPVLGQVYSATRQITGDQRWLELRIAGARAQEEIAPQLAGLRGGNFAQERLRIEAEHSARMRQLNPENKAVGSLPTETQFGIRYAEELRIERIETNRRLMRAERMGGAADIEASGLEAQRDFTAAARRRAYAHKDTAVMAAPENERGFVAAVEQARLEKELAQIGFEQRERVQGLQSRAMVGETLATSGGAMTTLAGTVGRIRSMQAEMRAMPRDAMTQLAAQSAYSAELRAMEAGLLPRGGGYAATASPGTQIIGDPAGIETATRDREFALQAVRAAREGAGDTSPVTNESRGAEMLDVLKLILAELRTDPLTEQPVQ